MPVRAYLWCGRLQLFVDSAIERLMGNYNCNATSPVYISHHFAKQMVQNKQKGLIAFTSSPAGTIVV